MFNFFRRKAPLLPSLTREQQRDVSEELLRQDRGEGNDVEAVISLIRAGAVELLPGLFTALEKATVALIATDPRQLNTALVLRMEGESHLVVFTRNQHASNFTQRHPEYRYLIHVELRSLCKAVPSEVGLVINPEHPTYRFTFTPSQFVEFRKIALKPR